ncbi:MAG: acylphosphatase [Phycisphaeraceae bacterium]|nr:acylphosphatase [Phycisphaeraceae bacterium]
MTRFKDDSRRRWTVRYSGHVQGVGFRYTVVRLGRGLPLSGHVMNLPDGRVELVVQGRPSEVEPFLQSIQNAMADYIGSREIDIQPIAGHEPRAQPSGIEIRYY